MTRGGTGKTYASAFAMRELGFKRVLFLVHRGQLARQTKKSYEKVFAKPVSMGLVGAGYHEYDADYVFATVQTLNRDEHLLQYDKDSFDCIVLDEAHHVTADTYQKIMKHFSPKLWLGMTQLLISGMTMLQVEMFMSYLIIRLLMRYVCSRPWKKICYVRSIILELLICL